MIADVPQAPDTQPVRGGLVPGPLPERTLPADVASTRAGKAASGAAGGPAEPRRPLRKIPEPVPYSRKVCASRKASTMCS